MNISIIYDISLTDSPVTKARTRAQEKIDEPPRVLEEARERAEEEKARLEAEEERKKGKEQAEEEDLKRREDEEQRAKLDEVEDLISITIMGFDFPHEDMADFRVAPSRQVATVQEDYAKLIGVPVSQLVFIHEGREMGPLEATLSENQIEDGDFIKVKRKLEVGLSMRDDTETEKQTEPQTEQQNDDHIVDPGGSAISESLPRPPIKVKFVYDEELSDANSIMIDSIAPSKEEQTPKKCPTTEVDIRKTDNPNKRQKSSDADNVIEATDEENEEVFVFDEENEEVFSCTKCYYSAKKISSVKKHMAWHGKSKEERGTKRKSSDEPGTV